MSEVKLLYRRAGKLLAFSGSIVTDNGGMDFNALTFREMMGSVRYYLLENPGARLIMRRTEASYPAALPEEIEGLLRTNFDAAMQILSPPDQTVMVRTSREPETVRQGLRCGQDTLADAFGEELHISVLNNSLGVMVESPLSGRWEPVEALKDLNFRRCQPREGQTDSCWGVIDTELLLGVEADRYYLPRRWNSNGTWITRPELFELFASYKKEKDQC